MQNFVHDKRFLLYLLVVATLLLKNENLEWFSQLSPESRRLASQVLWVWTLLHPVFHSGITSGSPIVGECLPEIHKKQLKSDSIIFNQILRADLLNPRDDRTQNTTGEKQLQKSLIYYTCLIVYLQSFGFFGHVPNHNRVGVSSCLLHKEHRSISPWTLYTIIQYAKMAELETQRRPSGLGIFFFFSFFGIFSWKQAHQSVTWNRSGNFQFGTC